MEERLWMQNRPNRRQIEARERKRIGGYGEFRRRRAGAEAGDSAPNVFFDGLLAVDGNEADERRRDGVAGERGQGSGGDLELHGLVTTGLDPDGQGGEDRWDLDLEDRERRGPGARDFGSSPERVRIACPPGGSEPTAISVRETSSSPV
jgi:hypothetical protein